MAQASGGDTVRIHYTGTLQDGRKFDSSAGREPLQFTIGENRILRKLEEAVVGMSVGDTATVAIAAADAYGPRDPEAVQQVDRDMIPDEIDIAVGNQLQATTQTGQTIVLTVVAVNEGSVTVDGNHPLAGEDLTFAIELVEILAAA
jgi:peptidylprolyl isomerase